MPIRTDEDSKNAIAITGVSGRFPESNNINEFKENLINNIDMITGDDRRWTPGIYGLPARSGKLRELTKFDALFFSVHAKQAHVMDPQLRLLLELTHEAIIDAGYNPVELRGSKTGVFIGISGNESDEFWTSDPDEINGYGLTGCCRAMFPNRISYTFDFNGPSYAIDTACSSSMFALEQAVTALRNGLCDNAIVGGVNLLLKPTSSLQFHRLGMLSPDGKCKAFDASGNGYVRAEAAAIILLQKQDVARRIYSYVLNAKTNTDGYKVQGITYPSGEMQRKLIEEVYSEIKLNPVNVEYVEAHGTGTKVGDPQEVNSIAEVFCRNRQKPLLLGSVKSNMGHSEPASGLCSIAKLIIAIQTGIIPGNLHFYKPNPDIDALNDGRLKVVDKNMEWNRGIVGVNSFGFGGANAHVILKPYKVQNDVRSTSIPRSLVMVSGRTEQAVSHFLESVKRTSNDEVYHLVNKIHSLNIPNHDYRGFLVNSKSEIMPINTTEKRPVWFIFSGMGTQWSQMARDLMIIPLFHTTIVKCAKVLEPFKINLIKILTEDDGEVFENVQNSFISIASVQIALTEVLRELKVVPDGIIGHSIGEIGCAYADETFTIEQAMLTAYSRGCAILDSKLPPGAMAAVGLSWEECVKLCPPEIQPACHNSDDSVTISGPPALLEAFTTKLTSDGIFAKVVKSSNVAFHSKYIRDAGPKLRTALQKIIKVPKKRSPRWISSSIPQEKWSEPIAQYSSVDYHVNNLLSPVLFRDALTHIPENAIVIEIAPHCLLQAILKRSLANRNVHNLGLMKRDCKDNFEFFMTSIGKLYNCGLLPDINKLYPAVQYPVSCSTDMLASMVQWDHSSDWSVADFSGNNSKSSEMVIEVDLSKDGDKFFVGHQIDGRVLFPATGYLTLVWKSFAKICQKEYEDFPVIFSDVNFLRATIMPKEGPVKFLVNIFHVSGQFELCESGTVVVNGRISAITEEDVSNEILNVSPDTDTEFALLSNDVYKELRLRGYDYANEFCGVEKANLKGSLGSLKWTGNWISFMDTMLQFSILGQNTRELYLPTRLQRAVINPRNHIADNDNKESIEVQMFRDINVIRSGGIEIRGMKASLAPRRQQMQSDPKLEQYQWIPYNNTDSLTTLLQIVIENANGALKLKVMEIMVAEELIMSDVVSILESEPMIHVAAIIANVNGSKNVENIDNVTIGTKLEENCHLIIVLGSYDLSTIDKNLKTGGMVLTTTQNDIGDLEIVAQSSKYYLLKKRANINNVNSTVIHVDNNNLYQWVPKIRQAMSETVNYVDNRIYLVSEGVENDNSGIIGLVNCLKQEAGGDRLRVYFLKDSTPLRFSLTDNLFLKQISIDLVMNVLKMGPIWGSYRHLIIDVTPSKLSHYQVEHAYINTLTRGDLSSLRWIEGPLSFYNGNVQGSELCYVYYAPLNFRDIMLATGKLPPDALPGDLAGQDCVLGLEFSGRSASNGRRIMGMVAARSLATTIVVDSSFLWSVPEKWSLEEAATIPVVYGTSYYALIVRGRMRPGESVLIHAGSGGVGQAAISIALHMKCKVFTTVGSQTKRDFLKQRFPELTDDCIGNSRDCTFEQMVLKHTKGRGVDLVLNSLADDKLQASIRCLAKDGRFLEIGKVDLSNNSPLGMSVFLKNVTFHGILLDALFEGHSHDKKDVMRLVSEGIESGAVKPLPCTVYHETEVEQAFRFMGSGKHIGKVLIKVRDEEPSRKPVKPEIKLIAAIPKTYMNPDKSYILIGGLGGFGLELSNWLIKRGAKKLVLTSRSGIRNGYQSLCVSRWLAMGINVEVSTLDCTKEGDVNELLKMAKRKLGPVGGIFNLAAVLRDAMIDKQTEEDFKIVCDPKVLATKYLDEISQKLCPELDYFVVFSSVSCGRGNAGQSNYGYANSVMERICENRQLHGLPAKAIQWGAIGDVGLILDTMKGSNDLEVGGTVPQRINSCLETIDYFLQKPEPIVASMVLADKRSKNSDKGSDAASLLNTIANILGIKSAQNVSMTATLADLGMDSLMGSEIKQTLERNYDFLLNAQEIRNLTFNKLLEMTASEIGATTVSSTDNLVPGSNGVQTVNGTETANGHSNDDNGHIDENIHFGVPGILMPIKSVVLMNNLPNSKNILFLVHPIEGSVEVLQDLANRLTTVAVYGLQCTKDAPQDTINELAQYYVEKIRTIQAVGPYKLCGYSFGACVAFEMALQLQQLNEQVHLALLDGSHMYVTMHTQKSRRSTKDDIGSGQCEALAYFVMQFTDADAQKVFKELLALKSMDERATRAAEYISNEKSLPIETIKNAAQSFYKKLYAASYYEPQSKFNGSVHLIRAKDNYVQMTEDYGLGNVCTGSITVSELEGNHRTILQGKSVEKITNILEQLF